MHIDGYEFMIDCVAKFHTFLYVLGWFHHPTDELEGIVVHDRAQISTEIKVNIPHCGVGPVLGPNKGFEVRLFRATAAVDDDLAVEFITTCGWRRIVPVLDLAHDRMTRYATARLSNDFKELLGTMQAPKILDIGGRARSGLDRRQLFPNTDYTTLDIIPAANVDVVGDAHALSLHFKPGQFDAVISVSVFEHLLMPWKAVTEINRVLKLGGIGLVSTHQTLGMHDLPWDFWRFSDTVWDALFNKYTGFTILDRALDSKQFVIPFVYSESKEYAERSVGFEGSAVLFRKTGPCSVTWDVPLNEIITSSYPEEEDGSRKVASR